MPASAHATQPAPLRVILVDDEPLARGRLRSLLRGEPGIEIVAECPDGEQAVAAIREHAPDLVFLDIQMPGRDGFGVIQAVGPARMPAVIFTTAFDQYALKAFDVHALDYLLKPFDRERFRAALSRARRMTLGAPGHGELADRLAAALAERERESRALDRLAIKGVNRIHIVKLDEVRCIEAAGNYLHIHAGAQEPFVMRETLSAIEGRLDASKFVRIHRSTIVNVDFVKELQPLFHGDYVVLLHGGQRVTLSRGYRDQVGKLTRSAL